MAGLGLKSKKPHRNAAGLYQLVPRTGLEPAQPFGHTPLKRACLPISPPGQGAANIEVLRIQRPVQNVPSGRWPE